MFPELKKLFQTDPSVTYLNHGSFGACPEPVFADYQKWQRLLEFEAVRYYDEGVYQYVKKSREALGSYVSCNADDIVFIPNPTYGINLVAQNMQLNPGDEILTTDLEYGAMDYTWEHFCEKAGAKYVRQNIRLPLESKESFIANFWEGFTERTKIIFISQITSATGLILPVREICDEARRRGLIIIVDGAHVPGHIPLSIAELDPDFYTGACHKWMLTPKGSSFLYVKKNFQPLNDPLVISWGYKKHNALHNTFLDYHQFNGTRDYAAYLTLPYAIEFLETNNWNMVSEICRGLVREFAPQMCEIAKSKPLAPLTEEFFGQMFSIPVKVSNPAATKKRLIDEFGIEVPVTVRGTDFFIRYSVNAYNTAEDLSILRAALEQIL